MAFTLPALPNFNVQQTPQPDVLQKAGQVASLRNMQSETALRNQLAPLDVQEKQGAVQAQATANQVAQLELKSRKAMMDAWSDPNFVSKVTTGDGAEASGHGFDPNSMLTELTSRGVEYKDAQALTNSFLERSKNLALMTKDQQTTYEKAHESLAELLAPIVDMSVDKAGPALAAVKQKLMKGPIPGLDQTDAALVQHADLEHLGAMINVLGLNGRIADFHKKQADATKSQQELPGGALSPAAKAGSEAQARLDVESSPQALELAGKKATIEANARQVAAQGDPNTAGHMLADGSLTLADLKSRGTTPQYITKAVAAAQKEKPSYNPADEVIAESVAKSQGAQQFFGSANSLINKGGTLDQLEAQGKRIPANQWPVLNAVEDWQKLATGKGPLAGYAATALGVADDYGKVMGGGTASDHARDAALKLFAAANSPEMRADAIKATRDAVQSQRDGRIGNNQFLKRLYGEEVSKGSGGGNAYKPPTNAPSATGANGHKIVVDGGKWVDAETGKPI